MGLIAPVTPIGATIFHVADVLGGLTMAQIIKPGTPVLFGGAPATFHMKTSTSPMAAIEALHLDVAYASVANYVGLPTQGYMALSDSKLLDAQAGAETFGSALLAALVGMNSVSGPGMLDYVLTFSLEKLIFDNDICGQALHFIRDVSPLDDIPAVDLARQLLADQHLLTAPHTQQHWREQFYLPNLVIDRFSRENWIKHGQTSLQERAHIEVKKQLAAYTPIKTDPKIDAELRRLIRTGLKNDDMLPEIPEHIVTTTQPTGSSRRRRRRKKQNG
jgi:trimethylamine--corrinoid protein Co-methyltransferase